MNNLEAYSLADPDVAACPFEYYKAMRADDPVHFDPKVGAYIVSRHADVLAALARPLVLSSGSAFETLGKQEYSDEIDEIYRQEGVPTLENVVTSDPPYHTRIRSLMDKAFTAHRVASMEPYIDQVANELIDGFIDDGQVEFVEQFAIPFPIFIIADQVGVPRSDFQAFKRWSDATVEPLGRQLTKERAVWCARQTVEMWRYLQERISERRSAPRDDMISDLAHAVIDDPDSPKLTDMELFQVIRGLIVAGNETTTTAIGNGLLLLIRNPRVVAKMLAADGEDRMLTRLTEEVLRVESPVPGLPRLATEDTELAGQKIPKGSLVYLAYASANRDDAKFELPETFDVERKNVGQHLAFGGGIHRCIGAMLARMEIKVSMRQMVKRLTDVKLAIPQSDLTYRPSMVTRTLNSLPISFTRP
jgi:cytochrome P450